MLRDMIQALKKSHLIWTLVLFLGDIHIEFLLFFATHIFFGCLVFQVANLWLFKKQTTPTFPVVTFGAQTCLETNLKVTSVSQLVFEIRLEFAKSFANDALRFCVARLGYRVVVGCYEPWRGSNCPMSRGTFRCRVPDMVPNSNCGPIPSF